MKHSIRTTGICKFTEFGKQLRLLRAASSRGPFSANCRAMPPLRAAVLILRATRACPEEYRGLRLPPVPFSVA